MKTIPIHRFADEGNSCVIDTPRTPRHWYNYLWSEQGYCMQVSQIGHGRSYYINSKADMCMINNQDAKYLYLRDDDENIYWNIGEGPLNEEIEQFSCKHNIGYSLLQSRKADIQASWKLFVPYEGYNEVWTVKVKNDSDRIRRISVFSAVSFELEGFKYPRYYEMYRSCETLFDPKLNGIYCRSKHPFAPHDRYNGYISCSEPVAAFDGNLGEFLGELGSYTRPDAMPAPLFQRPDIVVKGKDCTNSLSTLVNLGGVLQNKLVLEPGEEKELYYVLGVSESLEEAVHTAEKYNVKENVDRALKDTQRHQEQKYSRLQVNTPNEKLNVLMNEWVKKQVDFCIVGKKGVRDNLQIAVALLNYRQERAKEEIIECLRHQFKAGHAVLTWYPYDDTRYSDQPFWIIWAVCELIKETGDYSLLDMEIEYQDEGSATMLEHIKAAVNRLIEDKGRNGLLRIFFADWNDALNITTDPEAESVMLSEQFCYALKELSVLARRLNDSAYADYLDEQYDILRRTINEKAWDGGWYMRALSKEENIGSKNSIGSKIYVNAQSWAVLADIPDEEKLPKVLKAIDSMEHDFGFPINMPPYEEYSPHVGRMAGMLPGLFENGGVYCHATGFKIMADCKTGRSEEALRTLLKIAPDNEKNPSAQSGAEPYVFTNCYSIHPKYYGKSYQSWTTGTSAWGLMSLVEGIMGIKRDYEGLRIDPCFPAEWEACRIYREFRGGRYDITIRNPQRLSGGRPRITIDGVAIEGNLLPLFEDREVHQVEVVLVSEDDFR